MGNKYGVQMKKDHLVYHYCSLEAFYSIIATKSFWLFSLDSSNDLEEMTGAEKVIDNVLKEEKYKNMNKPKELTYEFYSFCCTRKKDNTSHFNEYADGGKGVCLGIDTTVFEKYLKETLPLNLYGDYLSFQDVIYMDGQEETKVKKYLNNRLICIEELEKEFLKRHWDNILVQQKFTEQIPTDVLSHFKPILKIKNFEDETEVRILFDKNGFQSYKEMLKSNFDENDPIIKKILENPSYEALKDYGTKEKNLEYISLYLYNRLVL
jgi:hypothetical protein